MATPYSSGNTSRISNNHVSGNSFADALIMHTKWGSGAGVSANLTYSFGETGSSVYSTSRSIGYGPKSGEREPWTGYSSFSNTQKTATINALNEFSEVANISFTRVTDSDSVAGDLRFAKSSLVDTAWSYYPGNSAIAGDVWFSSGKEYNTSEEGTYGYFTFMHEIGHTLGLQHPHENLEPWEYSATKDSTHNTIMSYKSYINDNNVGYTQEFFPTTLMPYDIAAIQFLYGANMSTRSGDTVYQWSVGEQILETIWDGAGTDTIDWSNQEAAAEIDLHSGNWSKLGPSYFNGQSYEERTLAIAFDAIIENAHGGSGNDRIIGNDVDNLLVGNDGRDYIIGYSGNDILDGGNDPDNLFGDWGNDTVYGAAGNDTIDGGWGLDSLLGGIGHDRIVGGIGDDTIVGDDGSDSLMGGEDNDRIFGGNGNDTLEGGNGNDSLIGGVGNDTVYGRNGNDTLVGEASSDSLMGGDGNDKLYGGFGNDTLLGGQDSDSLLGGTGHDKLYGGSGNDTVIGNDNSDYIYGGSNDDKLYGGNSNDTLYGESGDDTIYGGVNNDKLYGGDGEDLLIGEESSDRLSGGNGADILYGNSGNDTLSGDAGNDILYGESGYDRIYGANGDDTIYAGSGNDSLFGGSGDDLFVIDDGDRYDKIFDFMAGANTDDVLDFSQHSAVSSTADLTITQVYNGTLLTFGTSDSMTLLGVNMADLHNEDYWF